MPVLLAMTGTALGQDKPEESTKVNLLELVEEGGIMMWPLGLLSIAALVLIILFFLTIRRATVRVPIEPAETGTFTLPSIDVTVGAETYATRPLTLRVVEDMQGAELGYLDVNPQLPSGQSGRSVQVRWCTTRPGRRM